MYGLVKARTNTAFLTRCYLYNVQTIVIEQVSMYTSMYVSVPSGLNFVWLLNCLFQRYMFCIWYVHVYRTFYVYVFKTVTYIHVFQIIISYNKVDH